MRRSRRELGLVADIAALDSKEELTDISTKEVHHRLSLRTKLLELHTQEERNSIQKCKFHWMNERDENTEFFHRTLAARKRKGFITEIHSDWDEIFINYADIETEIVSFFEKLYCRENVTPFRPFGNQLEKNYSS